MTFGERMMALLEQGASASMEFAAKAAASAGEKAQRAGERGVLMLEIRQLESQAQRLLARLGSAAYAAFAEQGLESLGRDAPGVAAALAELAAAKGAIELKEAALREKRR